MSKKSPIIVNPARPEVDIETSFKLRDRLEIRPRRAVDDLRKSGEIDPDQLARFAEQRLPMAFCTFLANSRATSPEGSTAGTLGQSATRSRGCDRCGRDIRRA